ncbi:MAG: DUF362 domain-containing protein [Thermoguttaceae bacterium]
MFRIRQKFDLTAVSDVVSETNRELQRFASLIKPNQTVAITAGSRGITSIVQIIRAIVDFFHTHGAKPFVVPAMGSHGGGTAEGQLNLLEKYGITEEVIGCPIRSSMETAILGTQKISPTTEIPLYLDKNASEADHIFLVNRVKPHTRFSGQIESGLLKMLMIGLGKAIGANTYHKAISDENFSHVIIEATSAIRKHVSVLGGIGIVENAVKQTAVVRSASADELEKTDEELLVISKRLLPRIPFDDVDLLIIEQIGKNISGTGLDTNVVGRKHDDHKAVSGEVPIIRCIAVLGLTPETRGNACGIGIAEFCKTSVLREMNVAETRLNAITANHVSAAMLPLDYETEEEILEAANWTLGGIPLHEMKILRIKNTQDLETIECSEAYKEAAIRLAAENKIEILQTVSGSRVGANPK